MSSRITNEHVEHWLEHGYVIVENFLSQVELSSAMEALTSYFAARKDDRIDIEYFETKMLIAHLLHPFPETVLNSVMLHPDLLSFAQRVLDSQHVALVQSGMGAKYASMKGLEQDLHLDYLNNDLVVPRVEGRSYQQVAMLLY